MSSSSRPPRAWYALRRTLPPWSFEENLRELVECLPRYRVDELIVKVDTEEFSHGQPPLAWVEAYRPNLYRIREAMDALGVVFSINPWITVGHNDRGRDSRRHVPGLRTVVGHDGVECRTCACPLSKAWREHITRIWRIYAETGPRVLWVEDDIRTFNHRPATFGCFCPDHLRRFSERVGEEVGREALVSALLHPGEPHPWRGEYLAMQGEIMVETAGFLRRSVQDVDPRICLGLMSSGPRMHCLEGRDWPGLAEALSGGHTLYSRPPLGSYREVSLRGLYICPDSIKLTRACLPSGTVEQTEVENVPFTTYSKSAVFTFLQMAVTFAHGCHGVTLNLFDHCGTAMESEPAFGQMLGERKAFLEALAAEAQRPGVFSGVRLLHHPRASFNRRLEPGAGYADLREEGYAMMEALESHGIATTFDPAPVAAASGQTLRAFSDAEIVSLLDGGLLLDGVAAGILVERGFGADIGLRAIGAPVCIDELGAYSAEECFHPDFGGAEHRYLTATVPGLGDRPRICRPDPGGDIQPVSRLVDPDGVRDFVMAYAFENARGGRVFVCCYDLEQAYGVAWCHPFRRLQLQSAVRWLAHGAPGLMVQGGAWPLAMRRDAADRTLLGLFNLTLDPWPGATFELGDVRPVRSALCLTGAGEWRDTGTVIETRERITHIRHEEPIRYDAPVFLSLRWA